MITVLMCCGSSFRPSVLSSVPLSPLSISLLLLSVHSPGPGHFPHTHPSWAISLATVAMRSATQSISSHPCSPDPWTRKVTRKWGQAWVSRVGGMLWG